LCCVVGGIGFHEPERRRDDVVRGPEFGGATEIDFLWTCAAGQSAEAENERVGLGRLNGAAKR